MTRPDQLDVQVAVATNTIRRWVQDAQRRLNLPVTPFEQAVPEER